MYDVQGINGGGNLYDFIPLSDRAAEWFADHIGHIGQTGVVWCELRYAADIAEGFLAEGLTLDKPER